MPRTATRLRQRSPQNQSYECLQNLVSAYRKSRRFLRPPERFAEADLRCGAFWIGFPGMDQAIKGCGGLEV